MQLLTKTDKSYDKFIQKNLNSISLNRYSMIFNRRTNFLVKVSTKASSNSLITSLFYKMSVILALGKAAMFISVRF